MLLHLLSSGGRARAWRRGATLRVGAGLAMALVACSSPTAPLPSPAPKVPLSKDPPLEFRRIFTPSEPMELPKGSLAFLADQGTNTVYQYDLGRGRFLGPATRLGRHIASDKPATPGYPVQASETTPQGAAVVGSRLVVAAGADGVLSVFPITRAGLGPREQVPLPVVPVPSPGCGRPGEVTTNAFVSSIADDEPDGPPRPGLVGVVALDDHSVVVLSDEQGCYTVAYVVDLATKAVLRSAQIADDSLPRVAPYASGLLASDSANFEARQLLAFGPDLSVARRYRLPGPGGAGPLAVVGDTAIVAMYGEQPVRLVAVDLNDGSTRVLSSYRVPKPRQRPVIPGPFSGPVLVSGTELWWGLQSEGPDTLRHISVRRVADWTNPKAKLTVEDRVIDGDAPAELGPAYAELGGCDDLREMVKHNDLLLATCNTGDLLARIPLDGGPVVMQDAGSFPGALVLGPRRGT